MTSKITIEELERLYGAAVELDGAARRDFLEQSCAGRPALRAQLEAMLSTGEGFLAESLMSRAVRSETAALQKAGRWRLEEKVGEGGLGVVYRAVADVDGVPLEAAVKVLRPGFDGGGFRHRFQAERQILASLEHPGIARLIDCGTSASGWSFLAMEYIRGQELGAYLSTVHPTLRQRVDLMESVAKATEYLHSKLVVHGDIKPGNVMVTETGMTKLLDFGAARLLEAPEASGLTRFMLTPHYASPEQKQGAGPSVAGDIYSLGRLLADVTGEDADRDLQAIMARCVENEPGARYASVAGLLEDLERWRSGYPVRARRLTVWYSLGRFMARNRIAVALGGLLLLAIGVNWWNSREAAARANKLLAEARSQETKARQNAERATAAAAESERQRLLAEGARRAANENAAIYRDLLDQLGEYGAGDINRRFGETEESFVRGERAVIKHLERARASDEELAYAWRRLGIHLGRRGSFREAVAAFDQSIRLARQWNARAPSAQARAFDVMTNIYVAAQHWNRTEGHSAAARIRAAYDTAARLPAAEQRELEKHRFYQVLRYLALTGAGGEEEEPGTLDQKTLAARLEILRGALAKQRRDLAGINDRQLVLRSLVPLVKRHGRPEELGPLCEEVQHTLLLENRAYRACFNTAPPSLMLGTPIVAYGLALIAEMPHLEFVRRHLIADLVGLAGRLGSAGRRRDMNSAAWLASLALSESLAIDPDNPQLLKLQARVKALQQKEQ